MENDDTQTCQLLAEVISEEIEERKSKGYCLPCDNYGEDLCKMCGLCKEYCCYCNNQ